MSDLTRSQRQLILKQIFLNQKFSKSELSKVRDKAYLDQNMKEISDNDIQRAIHYPFKKYRENRVNHTIP